MVSTQDSKARIGLSISQHINIEEGIVADINNERKIVWLPVMHKVLEGIQSGNEIEFTTNFNANSDKIDDAYYMIVVRAICSGLNDVMLVKTGSGTGGSFSMHQEKRMAFYDDGSYIIQSFDNLVRGITDGNMDGLNDADTIRFSQSVFMDWCMAVPVIPVVIGGGFDEMDAVGDEGNTELGLINYTPVPEARGVGSCRVFDDLTAGEIRVYGKDYHFADKKMYMDNGFIKVAWNNSIKLLSFYHSKINQWENFANIGMNANYAYNFYLKKNTEECVELVIQRFETDDYFIIRIKRGSPLVYLSGTNGWNTTNQIDDGTIHWSIINKGNDTLDCVESAGLHSFNLTTGSNSYYTIHNKFLRTPYSRGQAVIVIGRLKVTSNCQWNIVHDSQKYINKVNNILDDDVYLGVLLNPYVFYNWMECEDMVLALGATSVADAGASGGYVARLDAQNEKATLTMNYCNEAYLPKGKYRFYYRAKDTNQITNDLLLRIKNTSNAVDLYNQCQTLTASYGWKYADFEIDANEEGDTIEIFFMKQLINVNSISLDEYFIIPRERSDDSLTHQDFIDGKWGIAKSYLKQVTQKISHARRD